jgi:hypothetical protein
LTLSFAIIEMGESKNPEFHCYRVVRCWKHKNLVTPRHNRLTGMGLQAITTATTSSANDTRGHGLLALRSYSPVSSALLAARGRKMGLSATEQVACRRRRCARRDVSLSLSPRCLVRSIMAHAPSNHLAVPSASRSGRASAWAGPPMIFSQKDEAHMSSL